MGGLQMNRWMLYGMLKRGLMLQEKTDEKIIKEIEKVNIEELKEGVIEYLLMIKRDKSFELYR